MKSKHIAADTGGEIYVIILDPGRRRLQRSPASPMKRVSAASLTAIGAFETGNRRLVRHWFEKLPQN